MTVTSIMREVEQEIGNARAVHPGMNSAHEGYAVMLEEFDELWDEVKQRNPNYSLMRREAIQVAAMAVCFINEVTDTTPMMDSG